MIANLCFLGDLDRLNTIPSNRVVLWKQNFFNDLDCPNGALFSTIWVLIWPAYIVSLCEPNIAIFFFLNRQQKKLKRRFHHEKCDQIILYIRLNVGVVLAGYELIITNSAYGLVGYIYQLISGASSKNNC